MRQSLSAHAARPAIGGEGNMRATACVLLGLYLATTSPHKILASTYFVRQTVGNDSNDGTSPDKAWQHVSMLTTAMHAGDTTYVGPGLYREQITLSYDGS